MKVNSTPNSIHATEADGVSLEAHSLSSDREPSLHTPSPVSDCVPEHVLPDAQDAGAQESQAALEGPTSSERLSDLSWCTEWQPFKPREKKSGHGPKRRSQSCQTPIDAEPSAPKTPSTEITREHSEIKPDDEDLGAIISDFPFRQPSTREVIASDFHFRQSIPHEDKSPDVLRESMSLPSQVQEAHKRPRKRNSPGKHRRNPANVFSGPLVLDDSMHPNLSIAKADTPILSPNPISPSQQLKLTRSIPHLMKSLPPLPREADEQCESPGSSSGPEVSTRLLFTSPTKSLIPFECEDNSSFLAPKTGCEEDPEEVKAKSSKFRIKMKTSQRNNSQDSGDSEEAPAERAGDYKRPRLKLKISRSQMKQGNLPPSGTVIHSPELKMCSSLSELRSCPKQDLFTRRSSLDGGSANKPYTGLDGGLKAINKVVGFESSPMPSDQFDIPYPQTVRGKKVTISSDSGHGQGEDEAKIVSGSTGRRGLRQKVSLLRLRVTGPPPAKSQTKRRRRSSNISGSHERSSSSSHKAGGKGLIKSRAEGQHKVKAGPKKRARSMRKWAFEARRVVRSCVRRLDRSSRSSK